MFDNPQREVKNTSKKLRPIKMSDEEFELFYKEIYAEFGPKDVPPVELNPKKKEVAPEQIPEEVREEVVEETCEEIQEESVKAQESFEASEADEEVQEEAAKAAALIRNVQDDEVIDEDTEGVTLVKPKKKKGIKGLVIAICLELLAIAAIAGYWLLYLL